MKARWILSVTIVVLAGSFILGQSGRKQRLNPMIDLLEQRKPIFGLYAPSNPRPGRPGPGGAAAAAPAVVRTPAELAKMSLDNKQMDYLFNGSMEDGLDSEMPAFIEFMKGMSSGGVLVKTPSAHFSHPVMLKIPKISTDPAKAIENLSRQLNLGSSGAMFVDAESADEVQKGLAAMRFKSKGGTRPDDLGSAPAYWGMNDKQYREKADLWPLNPNGELVNFTIIETKEGLAHTREIAKTKGIGVLWPGAGSLRQVFRGDPEAWEKSIQQVLAACKEFNIPCGYPANAGDIEKRMKEGFSVFVMGWGDDGFKAIDIGKRAAGRSATNQ